MRRLLLSHTLTVALAPQLTTCMSILCMAELVNVDPASSAIRYRPGGGRAATSASSSGSLSPSPSPSRSAVSVLLSNLNSASVFEAVQPTRMPRCLAAEQSPMPVRIDEIVPSEMPRNVTQQEVSEPPENGLLRITSPVAVGEMEQRA